MDDRGMAQEQVRQEAENETAANGALFPLFKDELAYQAQLLARITQNDYMNRIADTGIAPAQAYVLGELWLEVPLSQVELARRLEIGKATVGQTLVRLERAGLIERKRISTDRRVIMVYLTAKGRELSAPLGEAALAQNKAIERRLGKDRVNKLITLLKEANALVANAFARDSED